MMSVSKYIGEDLDTDKGVWKMNEEESYGTFTKIHATILGFRREKAISTFGHDEDKESLSKSMVSNMECFELFTFA